MRVDIPAKDDFVAKMELFLSLMAESFIALMPYTLLLSITVLMQQALSLSGFDTRWIDLTWFQYIPLVMGKIFPILLLISITFHFAKKFNLNHIIAISLSISIILSIEVLLHYEHIAAMTLGVNQWLELSILILLIPLTTIYLLSKFQNIYHTNAYTDYSTYVDKVFRYIPSFILTYSISLFAYVVIFSLGGEVLVDTHLGQDWDDHLVFLVSSIVSHLLWGVGVHGNHTVEIFISNEYLTHEIFNGMNYKLFYDLFIVIGGSGIGLALIIAILIVGRDQHSRRVAKLAAPLVTFNINEVLVYGLPIVFNKQLLIPFILAPAVNIILAFTIITIYPISIDNNTIPWTTPVLLNAYLVAEDYLPLMLIQLFLIFTATMMYIPFVKRYTLSQSTSQHRSYLAEGLDVTSLLQSQEGEATTKAQSVIVDANYKVEETIALINDGELLMYYQPKVDTQTQGCEQFEALLRLKKADGKIVGPYFLDALERGGLSDIIDLWVTQAVQKDLDYFQEQGFFPKISVNLHPDTISNRFAIEQICTNLKGYNVEIEVTEHSDLNTEGTQQNIKYLREQGFELSMDDFGSGYSSIENFLTLPIAAAKFDKSLVDNLSDPNGYAVLKHMSDLCIDIGCLSVAEGVETKEQYELLKEMNIDLIQGYYFSKPMPKEDIIEFKV